MKMRTFSTRLDPETLRRLRLVADIEGVTASALARQAVQRVQPLPRRAGPLSPGWERGPAHERGAPQGARPCKGSETP